MVTAASARTYIGHDRSKDLPPFIVSIIGSPERLDYLAYPAQWWETYWFLGLVSGGREKPIEISASNLNLPEYEDQTDLGRE